jgi:hypothetical protein
MSREWPSWVVNGEVAPHTTPDPLNPVWPVLIIGGVLLIGFTYFFRMDNLWLQAAMTAVLAVLIAGVLFLIFSLDHPFTGPVQVDREPFRHALQQFNALNLSCGRELLTPLFPT